MKELLARFNMKDGEVVEMHREDGNVSLSTKEHSVFLPKATGQQAFDLMMLLDGLAEKSEYPEEEDL